jgi:hypothetical protein
VRLGIVSLIFVACAGFLVWACFWLAPPRAAALVLVGAGYETNLAIPHNAYGRETLRALAGLAGGPPKPFSWLSGVLHLKHEPIELRTDTAWDRPLDRVDEKTVVLFLALHGGSDGRGAYLLTQDADPLAPDAEPADDAGAGRRNRLRLTEVLDRLAQLPAGKNKVLILDATQVTADWSQGMLHNDFARAVQDLEPRVKQIPNLIVLSASGPDQRSWVSDDLRQSVFGYYVVEGLRGAADANGDGRINAWELYQYVAANVERWARANRDALQQPVLLPWAEAGERRAQGMHLTLVRQPYQALDPAQGPPWAPPPELLQTWEQARQLSSLVPAPFVTTPRLWREYQAALLRYEQLLRAGDRENAEAVAGRVRDLDRDIRQAPRLDLTSVGNTLAMPALAGGAAPPSPGDKEQLRDFLDGLTDAMPASEFQQRWTALLKGRPSDPLSLEFLRLQLCDALLQRAAANPATELERSYRLLHGTPAPGFLADPLRAPAEVHYLSMLWRYLPQKPAPAGLSDRLPTALQLRNDAERTALGLPAGTAPATPAADTTAGGDSGYAYSEQVAPWIQGPVAAGDGERRLGEDLLFASDSASWNDASARMQKARDAYQEAQRSAAAVRRALALRAKVLADLPACSRWAAVRPREADAARQKEADELLGTIEDTWAQTHRLALMLESRPVADPEALRQQADAVDQLFRLVAGAFDEYVSDIHDSETLASWRETEAVLTVPLINPKRRMEVLELNHRIARKLLVKGPAERRGTAASLEVTQKLAKDAAHRQGRMALAILGRWWFDQLAADHLTFDETGEELKTFAGRPTWWEPLGQAQEEIAFRQRELPHRVRDLVDGSRKAELAKARPALAAADRLERQLDAAGCLSRWQGEVAGRATDAAGRYRAVLLYDLLLTQARRTLEDHWFGEEDRPGAKPYYQVAGQAYLADAARLVPEPPGRPALQALADELSKPGRLVVRSTPRSVAVTSEPRFAIDYQLQAGTDALTIPGFPVFRVEADQPLQPVSPEPGTRLVWPLAVDRPTAPIRCVVGSPGSALEEGPGAPSGQGPSQGAPRAPTRVLLHGMFRGQRIEQATPVDLSPVPERVVYQVPMPPRASIAVRTPEKVQAQFGEGGGAIAIVLDCSGSMGEDAGVEFTPQTKYNQVTRAVREVLSKLPRGTMVSLWMFGQAGPPGQRTVTNAEDTITHVQEPVAWNPEDPEQLKALMARVEYPAVLPWNETPLARVILQAKNDVANAPGFRTILVLTDGMDNRFDNDRQYNKDKKGIGAALREAFWNSGIVINIVGFRFPGKEEEKARQQFKVIEEMPLPGKFYTVNEASELAATLEGATKQRLRYWVDREDNERLRDEGLDVSVPGANDQWFPGGLPAGGYRVRVQTNQLVDQSVLLTAGDLLLLNLDVAAARQQLRRVLVSQDEYHSRRYKDANDWRLAVLQNQRVRDRGLEMLLMLEKLPDRPEAVLEQVRPRETWVELAPAGADNDAFHLRWGYQPGYPAPAWAVGTADWPLRAGVQAPARPVVRLWWNPNQEATVAARVVPEAAASTLLDISNRPVPVEGEPVLVESVQLEKHRVAVAPGRFETRDCLAVRVSYPVAKPVKIRLNGLKPPGEEHRYYTAAGKLTALFWPVVEADVRQPGLSLGVISLNTFKDEARAGGYYVELDTLAEPQATDARPLPPSEVR